MSDSLYAFADKLSQLLPTIMKEFARRNSSGLLKIKLTLPQFFILNFLNEAGQAKMTDLANFMRVSTAAMTGIVDRLVKTGYAARVYDPTDRRIIKIKVTTKGSEVIRKICQQRRQMIIKVFGRISRTEREDYLRILARIRDILTKEEDNIG
jgi:DNA-binding MarR family transcriptional regulator